MASIYDYELERADGSRFSLAENKGKVMIIVNTATGCGFTPHYEPWKLSMRSTMSRALRSLIFPAISSPVRRLSRIRRFTNSAS